MLQDDVITMLWLLCYGQALQNTHRRTSRVNNSAVVPRLEFGAAQVEQLRARQSPKIGEIMATVELVNIENVK